MSKVMSETLGELIKKAIVEKSLNQSAIARKMGVAKQTINQIEKKKIFDLDFLVRLRDASGLDFTSHALPNDKKQYFLENENSVMSETSPKYVLKVDNMPKLSYEFSIPETSYENIKSFQDDILKLAEKHGMIIN